METTPETDPTDVYEEDLFQIRRNPRRLLACGLAATLAVLSVIAVVRGGHDNPTDEKIHAGLKAPTSATSVPSPRGPAMTDSPNEDGDFFSRLFGERFEGLYDNRPDPTEATSGGTYSIGRCGFDLDVPDGWDTVKRDEMFIAVPHDESVAIAVNCQSYNGKPLKQIAAELPSEMPNVGKVHVLKRETLDNGYRLDLSGEDDKQYRVTWTVSGNELWAVTEAYHQGDDAAASTSHRIAESIRPTEAS